MSNDSSDSTPAHKRPDACKPFSCQLQKCLYESNYQMARCDHHLKDMIECCREWGLQAFSCEGFMWMFKDDVKGFASKDKNGQTEGRPDAK